MDNKTLGKFIAERRSALGLTQRQLAERLSVTDRAVSRWERGIGAPDISLLESLSSALGVTVDELLVGRSAAPKNEPTEHKEPPPIGIPYFYYRLYRIVGNVGIISAALFYFCGHPPYNLYPDWVEITGSLIGLVLWLVAYFVLYPVFYRCPHCGKMLGDFRPKKEYAHHCNHCGKTVYSDMTISTLREYLAYRKIK